MSSNALPRAVIFDWDNTLVDSWGVIAEAINYIRARYGLPTWTLAEILANCNRSARDAFPDWFGDKWEVACTEYSAFYNEARQRAGISPTVGAVDLLAWLKEVGIPALVVSNKAGNTLRKEESQLGWNKYFASVVGAHDAARDKPEREHADHALRLAGLEAGSDIWFIGDGESDIACARNSGCTPYLVGDAATAEKMGVDLFAADCQQILERLKSLTRGSVQ